MGIGAARALPSCGDSIRSTTRRNGVVDHRCPSGWTSALLSPCQNVVLVTTSPEVYGAALRGCSVRPPSGSPGASHQYQQGGPKNDHHKRPFRTPRIIDRGNRQAHHIRRVAALLRLPEPLLPLQLEQRHAHPHPAATKPRRSPVSTPGRSSVGSSRKARRPSGSSHQCATRWPTTRRTTTSRR